MKFLPLAPAEPVIESVLHSLTVAVQCNSFDSESVESGEIPPREETSPKRVREKPEKKSKKKKKKKEEKDKSKHEKTRGTKRMRRSRSKESKPVQLSQVEIPELAAGLFPQKCRCLLL